MPAKYESAETVARQMVRLRDGWPRLRGQLAGHLYRFAEMRDMLREAGCAYAPEQIGISRERLRRSYRQAWFIRRRYTVLDLAQRAGLAEQAMEHIFERGGAWGPIDGD
jgi:glycerol-1-phosphate dehydrogenase [NAD(P)+]